MSRELRNPEDARDRLVDWIADQVRQSATEGVVFGLSGGVDSAVVCGLCARALGPARCLGVILPIESEADDARLARAAAEAFDVTAVEVALGAPFEALLAALEAASAAAAKRGIAGHEAAEVAGDPRGARPDLPRMNLKPRLRMTSLYYFANTLNRLVVGTGNAAEFAVGYFTKYGDGGADVFPLGDLVKAEVWALARLLGVPEEIVRRAPSAGLVPGQTDEGELGIAYEHLDAYLLSGTSGDAATDARIRTLVQASGHKVASPPVARLD
ncbi:MAG TPA: NAD(+) synthase [Longimicrobiales bacterium]|nr:NAD(+) synthase [Longimicrobiales bacterium]